MTDTQLDCLTEILDRHEAKFGWYLKMVDLHLRELITSGDVDYVTADDAQVALTYLGLPEGTDTRFLGALWRMYGWIHCGYRRSDRRAINHGRAVSMWRLP